MITGLLIKRVADNMDMAARIIEGHYGQSAANRMIGKFFRNTIGSIIVQKNISKLFQGYSSPPKESIKLPDVKPPLQLHKKNASSLTSTSNDLGNTLKREEESSA